MPATFRQARDLIYGAFHTVWLADSAAVAGAVPRVFWDGVGQLGNQPQEAAWASAHVRHNLAEQVSLSDARGRRKFKKQGIVTIQIFVPLEIGGGTDLAGALAEVAKRAFEGKAADAVWFRNVRINEVGPDKAWYQMNVVAEFEYDEYA